MPRSQIVYKEMYEAWAIHCADCGEFIEHVPNKPNHHTFTCRYDCQEDTWLENEGCVEEW